MKKTYTNGYYDKVMYWKGQLTNANIENDHVKMSRALEKLTYFTNKQIGYLSNKELMEKYSLDEAIITNSIITNSFKKILIFIQNLKQKS